MPGYCPEHGPYDGDICPYRHYYKDDVFPSHPTHSEVNRLDELYKYHHLKVLLCYASSDKSAVEDLYKHLTLDIINVWLNFKNLMPGQDWELETRRAVQEADVVVVCISKQFNQVGFHQKEVRIVLDEADKKPDGEIFIVPARLEECNTLERLEKWHYVNLFEENGYDLLTRSLKEHAIHSGSFSYTENVKPLKTTQPKTMRGPKVFISYAKKGRIKAWVDSLSDRLKTDGIEIVLDSWIFGVDEEFLDIIEKRIIDCDYVLVVCTPFYKEKAEKQRYGEYGYDPNVITKVTPSLRRKFITIVREGNYSNARPMWAAGLSYLDFCHDPYPEKSYRSLIKTLIQKPESLHKDA
jgi:predicted nucleotide-binding protein